MRSRYVVILLLIVVAVLAAPFGDGFYFKQQYYKMIDARNSLNITKVSIDEYNLGWLKSTAILSVKSGNSKGTIVINQTIDHGPYLKDPRNPDTHKFAEAVISSDVHLNKSIEDFLLGHSGGNGGGGVMHASTTVSFANNYTTDISIAPFNVKVPPSTVNGSSSTISWQGLSGTVDTNFRSDYQITDFDASMQGGAFGVDNVEQTIRIPGMTSTTHGDCTKSLFCVGKSEFAIPSVILTSATQSIKITALNYVINSSLDASNMLSGSLKLSFNKYDSTDYSVGPFNFTLNVNNLNGVQLKKINDALVAASNDSEDARASSMLLLATINSSAPGVWTAKTSFDNIITLKTTWGNFNATSKLSWPAGTPLPKSSSDMINADFHMNARAATALVDQVISTMDAKAAANAPISSAPAAINLSGRPGTFEDSLQELVQEGLSSDELKGLEALQQKNVGADVFDSYVDTRVTIKLIPEKFAAPLKAAYAKALATPLTNVAANAGANKQLDVWVRENKITNDTRAALIQLQKQNLSSEIYDASIDDIVASKRLPVELGNQLKTQYESTTHDSSLGSDADIASSGTTAAAAMGQMRQQFDALVKQGFVVQEKDDYVVTLVYEKGVLKVNGTQVPLPWQ